MYKVSAGSIAALVFATFVPEAHAEYADTTGSLAPGSLSLAAEFQADMYEGTPFLLNIHESVGLASGLDLFLRQGLGLSDQGFYFGGGIKWTLLGASSRHSRPGVAAWFGGHGRTRGGGGGADATIAVDYPFRRLRPYLGLDANLEFRSNDVEFLLGLFGGVRISIVQNIAWFVEGGLGILGNPRPHFISTGPRIFI
jgi:hypothetical protein